MKSFRTPTWVLLFSLAIVLVLIACVIAGESLSIVPTLIIFICGGILIFLAAFVSIIVGGLFPQFRDQLISINLSFLLVLILYLAYSIFNLAWWPQNFENAKIYVAVAAPALEEYYQKHGHYPDTLSQLDLSKKPPPGLAYHRIFDPAHKWHIKSTWPLDDSKDEGYRINYYEAFYEGKGYWFVDN